MWEVISCRFPEQMFVNRGAYRYMIHQQLSLGKTPLQPGLHKSVEAENEPCILQLLVMAPLTVMASVLVLEQNDVLVDLANIDGSFVFQTSGIYFPTFASQNHSASK